MKKNDEGAGSELGSALSAYLPIDRRLALARNQTLPDRATGAALFADISGFTSLSNSLVQEYGSQEGAEILTLRLNDVYGALIAQVHRYHGSVVDFSGDAITCWFDQTGNAEEGILFCTRQAVTCALAMQRTLLELEIDTTPTAPKFPLSIKVAVTAGPVRRFQVGRPQLQIIDTLAGSTVDKLAAAEQLARQGEVVLDAEIVDQFGDEVVVSTRRTDDSGLTIAVLEALDPPAEPDPWPEVPPLTVAQARNWVPKPILDRLSRNEGDFLSELRQVTVLFGHFTGLDFDQDDQAGARLDGYIHWVQSVVAQLGGYLIDLTFGDKGSYFQASFGAPVTHEDNAERAVIAALKLRQPPAEYDFIKETQIGISRGMIRAGAYGSPNRRTYGIHGSHVNIAAHLMTAANPGCVLVTQPVTRAAERISDFREIGTLSVKGLGAPLKAFEMCGPYHVPAIKSVFYRQSPPIVGREDEQARLDRQMAALKEGQGGIAIIEGEAGIGKTRLMEAFVNRANQSGFWSLIGAGSAINQNTAYFAWQPIFQHLLVLDEHDSPAMVAEAISNLLADDPALLERLPLFNAVLPLDILDNELTEGMRGEVRASNTIRLLVHLIKRAQIPSIPFVLVIDDAHWIDSASWALLDRVRQEIPDLFLIIVTRPMEERTNGSTPAEYRKLFTSPNSAHYLLNAMSSEEVITLIQRRLGVRSLPTPIITLVQERAEGHPFFSEEIIFALRDAGLIRIKGEEVFLVEGANLQQLDFPDTIQGIITSRIDRLDPGEKLALKVASVIGRIFLLRTLQEIHPVETDRPYLEDYLTTLARLEITPVDTMEPELSYIFRHAITHDVAYSLLLYRQRRELHQAIAGWYEKSYQEDLSRFYPLLAYHWGKAEDVPKTVGYLDKAGDQALRNYANREAVEFLSQALALAEKDTVQVKQFYDPVYDLTVARWLRQLGEAYLGLGRLPDSRSTLIRMLALLRRPAPTSRARLIGALVKQSVVQLTHRIRPNYFLASAQGNEASALLEATRAYQHLAEIYYFANERALTLNAGLNVLNLSERVGPSPELARAYANMVVIAGLIPWHGMAEAYSRWALEVAEAVGDRPALAWTNLLVGTYVAGLGNWERVIALTERAIYICREIGDTRVLGLSLGLLTLVPFYKGDFERSRQLYEEWYDLAIDSRNIQHQAFGLIGQAESILPLDKAPEASEFAKRGLQLIIEKTERSFENRTAEIRGTGVLAVAYLRQGEIEQARETADSTMEIIRQLSTPTRITLLESLSGVAEVYLSLWEKQAASAPSTLKASAKAACTVMGQFARIFRIGEPRAYIWQGLFQWLDGRHDRAMATWAKSLAASESLNMPHEQALAALEIGRHASGTKRENYLRQALEGFELSGATYYLSLVRSLSARL